MIDATINNVEEANNIVNEISYSLTFMNEYLNSESKAESNIKNTAIKCGLAGAIRSLSYVHELLSKSEGFLSNINSLNQTTPASSADANRIIDFYLSTIDSDYSPNQKLDNIRAIDQMMRDNQRQRKEKLSLVKNDDVAKIKQSN